MRVFRNFYDTIEIRLYEIADHVYKIDYVEDNHKTAFYSKSVSSTQIPCEVKMIKKLNFREIENEKTNH